MGTVGAVDPLGVEGELSPMLPKRPCQELDNPEWLHASLTRSRHHLRPRSLCRAPQKEVLFNAALAVKMAAGIDPCGAPRQAAADCGDHMAANAVIHPLFVEGLFESHRVAFDAGPSVGEACGWQAFEDS